MTKNLEDSGPAEPREDPVTDQKPEVASEPVAPTPGAPRKLAIAVVVLAVAGLAAVYGMGGLGGNAGNGGKCAATLASAAKLKPFARGDVAAFTPSETRRDLSDLAFKTAEGTPTTLAAWKGRTVLLNLWATWCVPCRKEMPALDRLAAARTAPDFEVVAINLDAREPERSKTFLSEIGVSHIAWRGDPSLAVMKALQKIGLLTGLPTTILVDGSGCELGTMAGPAEWDRADALALIDAATKTR